MLLDRTQQAWAACETVQPVCICVLGDFQVVSAGQALPIPRGGKTETLLFHLALERPRHIPRSLLLDMLWPESDATRASQSLSSLIYSLHKLLSGSLAGASPVLQADGYCWL